MSDAAKTQADDIAALDLAALLASKVCHDIISPVGAVINGLEVLEEDGSNDEMRDFAMQLIRKSAKNASAKLQFARLAFGAAGSAVAEIDLGDARAVAEGYIAGEKPDLVWNAERVLMPKNAVKLILNLVLLSLNAIPRGGVITVDVTGEAKRPTIKVTCKGPNARVPPAARDLLSGALGEHSLDAHAIQPVYAGLLARQAGLSVDVQAVGEDIVFGAAPIA